MKINLLPLEERPLKQSQVRWEFLVGLIAVLALVSVLVFSWLERVEVATLTRQYEEGTARETNLQRQVQLIQVLRSNVSALEAEEKERQTLLNLDSEFLTSLPDYLNYALPRLWIERIVWQGGSFVLSGYTESMTSLSQYLNFLNELTGEATLNAVHPIEETGFVVFAIETKGVQQ